ncbi:hypothetical protein OAU13_00295 [bacterium]|nr:hypothetical protein [bacterium]
MYKTQTLNNSDIKFLKNLYNNLSGIEAARDFNLFSVVKKNVGNHPDFKHIADKLREECKGKDITHYFLKYSEGSFCSLHQDSPKRVTNTCITLIDKSDDLEGGDIIVTSTVEDLGLKLQGSIHRPTDEEIVSRKEPVLSTSKTKVLNVVRQDVGETVWYPAQMMHGVSLVSKGYRLVLISWYKDNEENKVYKETI